MDVLLMFKLRMPKLLFNILQTKSNNILNTSNLQRHYNDNIYYMFPFKPIELYKHTLKQIEKITGETTTYMHQLDKVGKRLFGEQFHGVYPADRIPKLSEQTPYCIQ